MPQLSAHSLLSRGPRAGRRRRSSAELGRRPLASNMKGCPECGRLYPDDAGFCPVEGQRLVNATQAPAVNLDNDARIGQVFCQRYEIRRVVADGGMGRVYEALDLVSRRNVAVKLLHPHVAEDEVAVE